MSTKLDIKQSQLKSWAMIIKDCKESGLTVPVYCEQHNITKHAYYYWYAKLKKEVYSQTAFVEIPSEPVSKPAVKEVHKEVPVSNSKDVIEIRSGNLSITIPINASKEVLSRIIEVTSHAQ